MSAEINDTQANVANEVDTSYEGSVNPSERCTRLVGLFIQNEVLNCELLGSFNDASDWECLIHNMSRDFQLSNVNQFMELFKLNATKQSAEMKYWNRLLACFIDQLSLETINSYVIPYCNENFDKENVSRIVIQLIETEGVKGESIVPLAMKLNGTAFAEAIIAISFNFPNVPLNTPQIYQKLIEIDDPQILTAIRRAFTPKEMQEHGIQQFVLKMIGEKKCWQQPGMNFLIHTTKAIGNYDEIALSLLDISNVCSFYSKELILNFYCEFLNHFSNELLAKLEQTNFLHLIFEFAECIMCQTHLSKILKILSYFLDRFKSHLTDLYAEHLDMFIENATNSSDPKIRAYSKHILETMKSVTGISYI